MKTVDIADAEWEIMLMAWDHPPITVVETVAKMAQKKGWHSRTTRTLLDRLSRKGALKITVEGKHQRYLYQPNVSREECVRNESRSFIERVFGGEPAPLLLHLVKETKLSREEIKELKKLLSDKEK